MKPYQRMLGGVAVYPALLSSVAPAQSPSEGAATPPSWAHDPPPKLPRSMWPTLDRYRYFIDCVANSEWPVARLLFDTPIGSREEDRVLARITGGDHGSACTYAIQMRMTSMLMRGGIAEARYRQVYGKEAPPLNAEIAPVPAGASFQWVGFNQESPRPRLYEFARCLVQREPGAVHPVLMTRIGNKDERKTMQALSLRFGPCLHPGERLRANSLTLRPWLAEALYQQVRRLKPDA